MARKEQDSADGKTPLRRYPLMLSEEEREAFRAAAKRAGMDLASWLRQLARRASGMDHM